MADIPRSRPPLVVGNWKMNTSHAEAEALVRGLLPGLAPVPDVEVVVCPPFPWLLEVARVLDGSAVRLGAQTMHTEASGAYTGEVSPRMLKGLVQFVLIGQYERRIYFSEKDAIVRRKLQVAQHYGLQPILCVGENADQLDEGLGPYIVAEQIEAGLDGANLDVPLVIAYDPVWTTMGLVAPPPLEYVGEIIGHMRETLGSLFSPALAERTRLIFGGPVNPRNVDQIASDVRLDGVLVGAASVNADNFSNVVRAFSTARAGSAADGAQNLRS